MSDFHPGIQECIRAIGEEAYNGVFDRHLTSNNSIPLCVDNGDVESERLNKFLPHLLYFYFHGSVVSPNEWYCFVSH